MGACCAAQMKGERYKALSAKMNEGGRDNGTEDIVTQGDFGALVRLQGCSTFVSMYSRQGRKGINQDAMTVWENFIGEQDAVFCGVFDGHGPSGHKVSQYVRDLFPMKLSESFKHPRLKTSNVDEDLKSENIDDDNHGPLYSLVKASLVESFKDMDEAIEANGRIESYCSGATAVTVLKKNLHLVIANLGDSRAILCTKGNKDHLVAIQLTVDLKPDLPCECERIWSCEGRVMALEEEPSIYRVWRPDQDCPGLAMSRAFGDFCLKDYGLISVPEIFYRKLTEKDEFMVLASDGLWDVLSNEEVIRTVSSAQKRSLAAKLLVNKAHRAWKCKYPCAKIDDCTVICLFFKGKSPLMKSVSDSSHISKSTVEPRFQPGNLATKDDGLESVIACSDIATDQTAAQGESTTSMDASTYSHRTGLMVNKRTPP
ncbi:PPM-type phosphatase domain-containing protein [Heracleum sosnowskyi]|uniref:PPM-type phosphatase domain-containing protein n=1 Tax=Heracleum sosnowskyi TaxID=360622 RepID=A0AAD8LWF5_9APIA|nr:PPM-type phosphatase domain-containing protein [Heracleum sosnowskyi]